MAIAPPVDLELVERDRVFKEFMTGKNVSVFEMKYIRDKIKDLQYDIDKKEERLDDYWRFFTTLSDFMPNSNIKYGRVC